MSSDAVHQCDVLVVGAGIVGLAVAREVLHRQPRRRVIVIDKEPRPGMHASSRNSGVLHCGIYYGSDTLKARICAEGARRMMAFASKRGIPFRQGGKVIVSTAAGQGATVERLLSNARDNGIPAERITREQLLKLEPHCGQVHDAIHCPTTAVIDGRGVIMAIREELEAGGVKFLWDCPFIDRVDDGAIRTGLGLIRFECMFNCAGAFADRVAHAFGVARNLAVVPFKGIYWKLVDAAAGKVRSNIYPVPDTAVPFLGVHLTRVIDGGVYAGPTAIPALGRENYHGLQGIRAVEGLGILARLSGMYWRNNQGFRSLAHAEIGKYLKPRFVAAVQCLVPSIGSGDLVPTPKAGIRPQLVDLGSGKLVMDHVVERQARTTHVLNAISPAFTGSMAFAEHLVSEGRL